MSEPFNNMDELEAYVLKQSERAISMVQEEVYMIIDRFLKQYYAEYTPEFYKRTYQLYKSLVKSKVEKSDNGYVAYVYFDLDKLDYSMKSFTDRRSIINEDGLYVNPFNRKQTSPNNWFHNKGYSNERTLSTAMIDSNPHGGRKSGTSIWIESVATIYQEIRPIFKKYLIQNGIPVK